MSREIKFRAWDIKKKEMVQVFRIDSHPTLAMPYSIIAGFAADGHMVSRPLINLEGQEPEFVLMQYAGFKGKDGVEIYEGDMIKCKCKTRPLATGFKEQEYVYKNAVVEWWSSSCNHGFRVRFTRGTMMIAQGKLNTMAVEVIGNIHQHPELLGG